MTTSQFACPHCNGRFQVDNHSAGATLACPHCGGRIAVPPGLVNDPAAPLTVENPDLEQPPAEPFVPFDFRDEPSVPAQPKIEPEEFIPRPAAFQSHNAPTAGAAQSARDDPMPGGIGGRRGSGQPVLMRR